MNTVEKAVMIEQGGNGPPADMRRAATRQSGSPVSHSNNPCIENPTEAVINFQAASLRRRFALGYYFATAVAQLAWGALPR